MKVFKGCTYTECISYKKTHYKKDDKFCPRCGSPLSYVCADCWKPLEDGSEKYCISCMAEKEQRKAERMETLKEVGGKAVAVAGTVGSAIVAVPKVIKDSDKLMKNAKNVMDSAEKIVNMIKK